MFKCDKCNAELEENAKFCINCGEKIDDKVEEIKSLETSIFKKIIYRIIAVIIAYIGFVALKVVLLGQGISFEESTFVGAFIFIGLYNISTGFLLNIKSSKNRGIWFILITIFLVFVSIKGEPERATMGTKDLTKYRVQESQDFYSYKLFDNKFQAVFPGEPTEQQIPNEYKKIGIKAYLYGDRVNHLAFTSQSNPSSLKYDVGEYKQSTKKMLDESITKALKYDGRTIINFSSTFNRKKNTYIAVHTSSYFLEGKKRYSSTKQIIYKKKVYKWTVMYPSLNDKHIFDDYQKYCKVIK